MRKIINWIKNNKFTALLLIVVFYFLFTRTFLSFFSRQIAAPLQYSKSSGIANTPLGDVAMEFSAPSAMRGIGSFVPAPEAPPSTDVEDRLVVRETNMSLLVDDVRTTSDQILNYVDEQGGYMVNSSISQPEEAPYGTIVVRIPSDNLRETMDYFRSLAIKVSSEFISGRDVTDQYEDIESRLVTLEKTKARFEEIMDQAVKIDDILRVQREIINLQSQIDNLKGRQQLLEGTARLAKITIHISTDEIALPYTPSETFRPNVIFKLAWRSLVRNSRKIATAVIWIAVYSVVWVPVLGIVVFIKRRKTKNTPQQQQ